MNRRTFVFQTAAASVGAALASSANLRAANAPGRKLRVAVVALGRGLGHVTALLTLPDVEIAYLAEVDSRRLDKGLKTVAEKQKAPCSGVVDFRTFLGDKTLDAVFIATPNFWHTPAALLCLQAGHNVYVEKPGSQNPHESEMIVAGAEKYARLVQMGNQRRTWMKEAVEAVHGGAIGTPRFGRTFYYNARGPIGKGAQAAAPGIDMDLWQGPVPDERDMKPFVHYDWHWLWHWGNGELGNNGIHTLDVLRWGLKVEYPERVTYNGGRYSYADPQETPDTGMAMYDCGKVGFSWEQSSCEPRRGEKLQPAAELYFYGDKGNMAVSRDSWVIFDEKGAQVSTGKGAGGGDAAHMGNFLEAIRGNAKLNSPIVEGQKSTMLCHLGNIAYRTRTVVQFDGTARKLINNPEGEKLWARPAYRKGWDVHV